MIRLDVSDIRLEFARMKCLGDVAGNGTFEIINASFIADEETIFGELNREYAEAELEWYLKQSLNVNDIPGQVPKIWRQVCGENGEINSNYGWCIFSDANFNQFDKAINCLVKAKSSRQSAMIYMRPTMHEDSTRFGMTDFMCTYAVQLFIRSDALHYIVYMRSNDAVFGYKNDRFWHNVVFDMALEKLRAVYPSLSKGRLYWNSASLHVYERHFHLIP